MDFMNLSSEKLVLLAVLSVILFGDRLPEVARTVAKVLRQLQKATREFQNSLRLDI